MGRSRRGISAARSTGSSNHDRQPDRADVRRVVAGAEVEADYCRADFRTKLILRIEWWRGRRTISWLSRIRHDESWSGFAHPQVLPTDGLRIDDRQRTL